MLYTEADFSVHRDGRKKDKQMATELARIAELSAQNPTMVFTSIAHLINVKLLRECHEKMDGDKAVGIDGVMKSLFYWLNRRSQKTSYSWAEFLYMLDNNHPLAKAKIYVSIYAQ